MARFSLVALQCFTNIPLWFSFSCQKKLFTVGSSIEWLIITLVFSFLNSEFRVLWFLSRFIYISIRTVTTEDRQAFAENTEWNVSAWIIRPEKLIVPQWTRSVNRMCGRMSLNHALCLGGLHKQSSQWSCVSSPQAGPLSVRVRVCVCRLWAAVIPAGTAAFSQGIFFIILHLQTAKKAIRISMAEVKQIEDMSLNSDSLCKLPLCIPEFLHNGLGQKSFVTCLQTHRPH